MPKNSAGPAPTADSLPAFVSRQVTEARRFFLSLSPNRQAKLEVVCGGVERMRPDYVVQRDSFPYYAIELVAEGKGTLSIDDTIHELSPGVAFAYGPGARHTIRNDADRPMRKYYLDFVGTRSRGLLREAGLLQNNKTFGPISIGALHEVTELFDVLIRNAGNDGTLVHSICASLTDLLMLKLRQLRLPEGSSLPQSYATYERIRRHIEQRFLYLHTVHEIASECEVTAVYVSRLFNRFSDCGAYQYLLRRKMNYAAGLLMNEGLLVKDVARRMEFADAFQFSRAFKRVYGIPPGQIGGGSGQLTANS